MCKMEIKNYNKAEGVLVLVPKKEEEKQSKSHVDVETAKSFILESPRMSKLNFLMSRSSSVKPSKIDDVHQSQHFQFLIDPGMYLPLSASIPFPIFSPMQGVIPGLEPIKDLDRIIVQESLDIFQTLLTIPAFKRYNVYNSWEQRVFFVVEFSPPCERSSTCSGNRSFFLKFFNCKGEVVLTMERKCNLKLFLFGAQIHGSIITVRSEATHEILGQVKQNWSCHHVNYDVIDKSGKTVLKILDRRAPPPVQNRLSKVNMELGTDSQNNKMNNNTLQTDQENKKQNVDELKKEDKNGSTEQTESPHFNIYNILSPEKPIGRIYQDILVVVNCGASYFGLTFPIDLDPVLKILLLGAGFCLDFSYFDNAGHRDAYNLQDYEKDGRLKIKFCSCCCCCCSVWFLSILIIVSILIFLVIYLVHFKDK